MAMFIPQIGPIIHGIQVPLWPSDIYTYISAPFFLAKDKLDNGDLVLHDTEAVPVNRTASALTGMDIRGDAIICRQEDLA